jgi:hypothetical protein
MKNPTTGQPCSNNRLAVIVESTPPLKAMPTVFLLINFVAIPVGIHDISKKLAP